VTAVDRPDNGQDEGRCFYANIPAAVCSCWRHGPASARPGAGEQQRERVMEALVHAIGQEMPMGVVWNLDRVTDRLIAALPELSPHADGETR